MAFVQNFPFISILICMFGGIVTSVLNRKAAKWATLAISFTVFVLSALTWRYTLHNEGSYTFMMGHFPSPWEIGRAHV